VNQRFKTPANALLMGAVITVLFCLLVYVNPGSDYHIWFVTYPAHVNALVSLVSFGVSGIYLSFLLTVIASMVARRRGWVPEGSFRLGKWGWPVSIIGAVYLGAMFVNVVYPSGLSSARAFVNIDWITLLVIVVIAVLGLAYLLLGRPDRNVERHLSGVREAPETAEAPPVTAA
jgi:amino acid transporter